MRSSALVVSLAFALSVVACGDNLPGNAPPDVAERSAATPEDTPVTINIVAEDPEGAALTYAYSTPANGTLTGTGASITYRPDDDYHGPDSFMVTVSDGDNSVEARISITVSPVNDDPVAVDDALAADEDTATNVDVATLLANDTDVDGDTLSISQVNTPSMGTASLAGGVVTYTPPDNFTGTATFTYDISDGNGGMATATVTVTVGGENDPPIAVDDTVTTLEDMALAIPSTTLTDNDTDADGQALSVTMITGVPVGGTAVLAGGTITFTPTADFNGAGGFDYVVSDGADTDTGHVTVNVTPVNDGPVATAQSRTTAEDTAVTITLAGTDVDGDALTFAIAMGPASGTLGTITQATPTTATVVYTPNSNFNGNDSFTFTVNDGTVPSAAATVMLTVTPANDGPTATAQSRTTAEDTAVTITLAGTDPDGNPLTFAVAMIPASGTLGTITQATPTTATVVYTPNSNFNGGDSFTFTVSDGTATSAPAAVMLTVTPVNDAPVATAQSRTTAEDTAVTITLAGSDVDGNPLTFAIAMGPASGTLGTITQATPTTATVVYTPNSNFNGSDSFTFTVNDGTVPSTPAAVMITVTTSNDPPVAMAQMVSTPEDTARTITLSGTDVEGSALTFAIAGGPASGTLGPITQLTPTTASVTYTPNGNFNGNDSFTFTVNDGTVPSTPAAVMITVTPVNDAPVATPQSRTTAEDTAVTITLAGSDVDGNPLTFAIAGGPTSGTLGPITQLTPTTASVTYTPNGNFNGSDSFTFTVNDGTVPSPAATVSLTVTPVNDGPTATAQSRTTAEDTAVTITLAGTDPDGNPLTFSIVASPLHGTLGTITQLTPTTASVTFTPASNYAGPDSFTFRVHDGTTFSAPATVSLTITPVNDPPIAINDNDSTSRNTAVTRPFSFYTANDNDGGDGGPLTITLVGSPVNGSVAITGGNSITFTPDNNFVGTASFVYTLSDGTDTTTASVSITVINTNTPVVAVDDDDTTPEDTALVRAATVYTANDIDPDPQVLTVTGVHNEVNGTLAFDGTTITFTPADGYSGPASFQYDVTDGFTTDVGQVNITVTPVNDSPDAVDDTATVAEDGSVGVPVLANDSDDGPFGISAFTQGANGSVSQTLNTLTYVPNANFSGTDTFTYTIMDLGGLSDTATVTVTVTPVPDAPVANNGNATTNEGQAVTITLTASDVDVPAVSLVFAITDSPDNGTLGPITPVSATSATVVYTPNALYFGPDSFQFTASDGALISAPATVSITVNNVVTCGDGTREAPETCDDGNLVAGDGCSITCATEQGWDCGVASPSVCTTVCGDNFVVVGREECDDMNGIETDGCTTQCKSGTVCAATVPALAGGDRFATDPATGRCYVSFDDEQTTFAAAQTACVASGGHLAAINSSNEQAIVASVHNLLQEPWIGLTDELVEGSFGWITGEPLTFNNFGPGQPDGGDPEDCVNLTAATSTWNDTSCTFIGFTDGRICELAPIACGDGFVQASRGETCDDGNSVPFDGCNATCQTETLFFSEYIEGSSSNKAVEIANPSNAAVNLTGCSLRLYTNGSPTVSNTVALTQTIAAHDVFVACNSASNAAILAQCDLQNNAVINFNGDDAIELFCGSSIDTIGQRGFDPGTEWGTGLQSTADNTLRRKCGFTVGDTINNDVFDPSIQWTGFANDTFGGLGAYSCSP